MGMRNIVKVGDDILRKKSRYVDTIDARILKLLDDMKDTMYQSQGVGLAAVQVGVLRRVVVIDCGDGLVELINPEIIKTEGEQEEVEGCLSVPGRNGITKRPMKVTVKAQDRNGNWCVYQGEGLKARCFCHEIDHLDGILFTDNMIQEVKIECEE